MGGLFSVEMESKKHVRSISISDEAHDRVLFEGDLGRRAED
jgi:DNA-binding protein YbaB